MDTCKVSTAVERPKAKLRRAIVLSCLGILYCIWIAIQTSHVKLSADFTQFYAAGKLAGTGHLYDPRAITEIEARYGAPAVPTARLPIVAIAFKPLSALPFVTARNTWFIASVLAGIIALWIWPDVDPAPMFIALAWSLPACLTLFFGQDVLFWLLFFASGMYLLRCGRSYYAGMAFALCICKFHLLIGLGVMLLARKEWKTIYSGIVSTAILLAACFAIEGRAWPALYGVIIKLPGFSPAAIRMPDVYGLVARLPHALPLELLLSTGIASALWFACRRVPLSIAGALASAVGLLIAHHAYAYDCLLLLPLCVIVGREKQWPEWMRLAAMVLLSPVFVFMLVSNYPIIAQVLVCTFVIAAIILSSVIQLSSTRTATAKANAA